MNIYSAPILAFRWVTFLLAGCYCLYQILSHDYSHPGGPFRFLTIWALFLSFYSASRMLALSQRRDVRAHDRTAACAAVLNVMVVFMYWRLFLVDPALVNSNGPVAWHQQYYLHALGPALQVFDALFIARAFGRPWKVVAPLIAVISAYILWIEVFVHRFNIEPAGNVTSGLPYPFLNNMDLSDRAGFYMANIVFAHLVLAGFGFLNWVIRRQQIARPSTTPAQ
jgi:hypothetical protein